MKNQYLEKYLKPNNTKTKYIGLELELISKANDTQLANEFHKAELSRYINIGYDGSIRPEPGEGYAHAYEVRCLIPQFRFKEVIDRICQVLQKTECKANRSCGLHVHLDMRPKTGRKVKKIYTKLVDNIPELKKMVADYRVSEGAYNPINRHNNFDDALKGKAVKIQRQVLTPIFQRPKLKHGAPVFEEYEIRSNAESRSAINPWSYGDHKTLEVRMKEGSVDAVDITKWVNKLVTIADG